LTFGVLVVRPKMQSFVFMKVLQTVGEFHYGEGESEDLLNLNAGDMYIVRYNEIKSLLSEGLVKLL
jgi:hypothetical protein